MGVPDEQPQADPLPRRPWWQGPRIWIGAILFVAAYTAAAYGWFLPFVRGEVPGPYWLLMQLPVGIILLVPLLGVIGPVGLTGWSFWQKYRKWPQVIRLRHIVPASIITALLLLPGAFPLLITPYNHADTLDANGRRYQLAAIYALIDTNYAVYECDPLGIWCDQLTRSNDYSLSGTSGHFEVDQGSGEVNVIVCTAAGVEDTCGVRYTFQP